MSPVFAAIPKLDQAGLPSPQTGDEDKKESADSEEQRPCALHQAERGVPVADVCRQLGAGEESFYVWKKKYRKLGVTDLRELLQLRGGNARLKRVAADLTLDKHIPARWCEKRSEAG